MTNVLSMHVANVIDFLPTTVLQNKHNLFKCCTYLRADLNSFVASNEVNESTNNSNNTKLDEEKMQDRKKQKRRRRIGIKLHFTNFDKKGIKKINVVYNYA
jgi:hypothetical protein